MAAFRDVAAFAQFGSDLDKATQAQLTRGQRLQEILKQPQYQPVSLADQVISIFAGTRGFTDKIPLDRMTEWETAMLRNMETSHPEIGKSIAEEKRISDGMQAQLEEALKAFNVTWS
jgi:F-type H+-transporting ATPase subunit alpha